MMHAYDKDNLYHAQKNFGHKLDFAVNTCDIDIDEYFHIFFASNICAQFEDGNPAYIAGKTGCELARLVVLEITGEEIDEADVMYGINHQNIGLGGRWRIMCGFGIANSVMFFRRCHRGKCWECMTPCMKQTLQNLLQA